MTMTLNTPAAKPAQKPAVAAADEDDDLPVAPRVKVTVEGEDKPAKPAPKAEPKPAPKPVAVVEDAVDDLDFDD